MSSKGLGEHWFSTELPSSPWAGHGFRAIWEYREDIPPPHSISTEIPGPGFSYSMGVNPSRRVLKLLLGSFICVLDQRVPSQVPSTRADILYIDLQLDLKASGHPARGP